MVAPPAGTPFGLVVENLLKLGFYDFVIPFILTSTILYALLRKSKFFGESAVINAVVSLSIGFMIFGFPVMAGLSLASPLSLFFVQATVFIIVFVVAMIMASIFYPDFMKLLGEQFTKRSQVFQMLALGIALFITSGLVIVFYQGIQPPSGQRPDTPLIPIDIVLIISAIVIFIVLILVASSMFGKSGGGE